MKFQVNVKNFIKAIEPVVYLANHISNEKFTDNCLIALQSSPNEIIASAYIGSAAIKASILEKDYYNLQYFCYEEGTTTVNATDFMNSLASFAPTDSVIISTSDGGLIIADETNEDDYQALCINDDLSFPEIATKFSKSMSIDRKILIDGLKSVAFAMGAVTKEHYRTLFIEASKNNVRFAAGTGARFAVKDYHGKGIVEGKAGIVLPRYDIFNLISILSKSSANKIQIKESEPDKDFFILDQVLVEFNETSIILFQVDSSVIYPNVSSVIDDDYKNRASAKLSGWK